jgi:hypothetical protein
MSWLSPFNWWPAGSSAQNASASSEQSKGNHSCVYLGELEAKLKAECRAERAECRLDFNNTDHCVAFLKHRVAVGENLLRARDERQSAAPGGRVQCLLAREKRLAEAFSAESKMQSDYARTPTLLLLADEVQFENKFLTFCSAKN